MPTVAVSVTETPSRQGYVITIDPFCAHVTATDDVIVWQSNCQIMIELVHPAHFPEYVPNAYGTPQNSGHIAGPAVAPRGTYHYKINILVDDTDEERKGHYKNVICIDPDYKVDR